MRAAMSPLSLVEDYGRYTQRDPEVHAASHAPQFPRRGPGRSSRAWSDRLRHHVLEQDLPVAGERLDQRQRGPADGARVGADRARRELDVAQAPAVEAFEDLRRARDQAIAHGGRHLSVDDDRLEVDDRDGGDRGIGERFGRLLDPGVEGRAELRPGVRRRPDRGGVDAGVRKAALELVDRGAGDQLRRAAPLFGAIGIEPTAPALPVRPSLSAPSSTRPPPMKAPRKK